jgi:hypothetical protein
MVTGVRAAQLVAVDGPMGLRQLPAESNVGRDGAPA